MENEYKISVCLSRDTKMDYKAHFQGLVRSGALDAFGVLKEDQYGTRFRAVVALDRTEWQFSVATTFDRIDLTVLKTREDVQPTLEQFRNVICAIQPFWAGMGSEGPFKKYLLSTAGSHRIEIPQFPAISYWSDDYCRLFTKEMAELGRFGYCHVNKDMKGVWVEIDHADLQDLDEKRKRLQEFLLPNGPWGMAAFSHAVCEALDSRSSYEDAVVAMEQWRRENRELALANTDMIFDELRKEVKRYGRRRKAQDVCTAYGDDSGMMFGWCEQLFSHAETHLSRCVLARRIKWSAILYDFVKVPFHRGFKTHAQCVVYNSCMKQVVVCELEL